MNDQQESGAGTGEGAARMDCQWYALHDWMPPRPPRLRVTGTCVMPTPGYTLTLTRAQPQGINPDILELELSVTPPDGVAATVLTPAEVEYYEETTHHYRQVHIRPDGFLVDVESAS
ncbi:MAG TPA: hypothetical protein VF263_06160 [Longimicrobiaceae bacterium]